MKKTLKNKWIKALRSGKFKQTRHRMVSDDGRSFCCLGVLDKICGVTNDEMRAQEDGWGVKGGLSARTRKKLVLLNDTEAYTFPQIADYIEKKVRAT